MFVRRFISASRSQYWFKRSYIKSNNVYKALTGGNFNARIIEPKNLMIVDSYAMGENKFMNKSFFIDGKEILIDDRPFTRFSVVKWVATHNGMIKVYSIPNDATVIFNENEEFYTDKIIEVGEIECGKAYDVIDSIFQMRHPGE
jgi:hypothetical protein